MFVLPKIEPGLWANMNILLAVLRAHASPSCWSKVLARENAKFMMVTFDTSQRVRSALNEVAP